MGGTLMRIRAVPFLALALPVSILALMGASGLEGQTQTPTSVPKTTRADVAQPHVVEQTFPPNGVMETAWKVEFDTEIGYGLVIKNAWFKKAPDAEWLQVLGDARVSDIFVPYQPGTPRYWDVRYNFFLSVLSAADVGPFGKLHTCANGEKQEPCVAQELRDRGVIWKNNSGVRRGNAMVLWGCLHAINYRYLEEYCFQDDGAIVFRMGSTGRNLKGREFVSHMHNYFWRVDVNLGGKEHNTAYLMENVEPKDEKNKLGSETFHNLFNNGKEGFADWDPLKFTMVRIVNTEKKNIRGENIAYDVVPMRHGTARHFGQREECAQHDFWITKANPKELEYRDVPKYANGEDIVNTDIVLWYGTSMFHEPRSEDGIMENNEWNGATLVSWIGFTLRPNNIFDRTPLYPNPKEPVQPKGKGKGKG
jgi:Cu2+-containing amine oxidase